MVRETGSNFDPATHLPCFFLCGCFCFLANTQCFSSAKHCSKFFANIYCVLLEKYIKLSKLWYFICKMGTIVPCMVVVKYKCDYVWKVLWTAPSVWQEWSSSSSSLLASSHLHCTCLLVNDRVTSRGLAWVKRYTAAFLRSERFYTGLCDTIFTCLLCLTTQVVTHLLLQQKEESEIHPECLQPEAFCYVSF